MEPDPTLEFPTIEGLIRGMFRNQHISFANHVYCIVLVYVVT